MGQVTPGESLNGGLAGAPVAAGGASQTAIGGAAGTMPSAVGGGSVGGSAAVGGASTGGSTMVAAGGATVTEQPPGTSPFPSNVTRPRIMIVGDSIAAGPGCYKKYLLAELNLNGFTNFEFVGEYTDDCGGGVMHSAVSCSTAEQYTQPTFTLGANCGSRGPLPGLAELMAEHRPDLLMIQLGVNDIWGSAQGTDAILASYTSLVQQARGQNPNIVIDVAQIHKIRPTPDASGDAVFDRARQLIEAVPAWAQSLSQPESPVFVADLWTNSDLAFAPDGVHPDDAGARRMALDWFEALQNVLPN